MTDFVQLPSGLVIPEAAFATSQRTAPLGEVATTLDGRDITRGYVDSLPLLPPTDSVLAMRGAYDHRIYDEVLRDDQVAATLQQRRLAVVSKEWEVVPGGDKRIDKRAAEFVDEVLLHIRFDAITEKMLYGVFYGYAVSECLWVRDGQHLMLDAIKVRDRRRFGYRPNGELVMKTTRTPDGEPLPPNKFWHFSCGASHDDEPYGLGLAHWLYWPVLFKRNGVKFWLIFLEKFGMPTGVGKFPSGAEADDRNKLLAAVQAIQADSGVIIPEGMTLELLEAARSGTADYTALHDRMNASISKVVLGHSASADATPGRLGGEDNAGEVRDDLVKADADLVCHSANASWVTWLTRWNFPGAAIPRIWRRVEEEPELKPQAERDEIITRMGFRPTLEYIRETYGDGWEEKQPDPPPEIPAAVLAAQAQPEESAFAEGAVAGWAEHATEILGRAAEPHILRWLEQVRVMLDQAESLEEFRAMLESAYDDLDATDLARVMGEAFASGHLAGGYEAEADSV